MNRASALKRIQNPNFKDVCESIVAEMKRLKIPGVSIGLHHNGQTFAVGFGVTNIEHPLPVTPDTLFQTGSISKTFTGTLIMRLVEVGKLALDEPVRTYLPSFKMVDRQVTECLTLRHLLTHTGGWVGDYFNDYGNGDDAQDKMVRDVGKLEQITPLGDVWSYNNTGFNIAGRIVEVVTGMPFEQAAREMLLDPLSLEMSFYFPDDMLIMHGFAVGHHLEGKKLVVSRPWAIGRAGAPVGGVVSTVKDLLAYARFHMGEGRSASGQRLLSAQSLEQMRRPLYPATGFDQIGLTWFIRKAGNVKIINHSGATHGQIAGLYFVPDKKFVLAVLTNGEDGRSITSLALKETLRAFLGVHLPIPAPIHTPVCELGEYLGKYEMPLLAFELKLEKGQLMLHETPRGGFPKPDSPPLPAPSPMRVAFYEKDKLIVLDEPMKNALGEFLRRPDGSLQYLRISSRVLRKMD